MTLTDQEFADEIARRKAEAAAVSTATDTLSTSDMAELNRLTQLQATNPTDAELAQVRGAQAPYLGDAVARHAPEGRVLTDQEVAKANEVKNRPDKYYPVKTGDTFETIATELGHDGEGQALFDHAHEGGISNGELTARHTNLISGADGKAVDIRGALLPVLTKEQFTAKTKLVEGQSLLLPKGW
jgi:LysM repeat protein